MDPSGEAVRGEIWRLIDERAENATICPSEVARRCADDWRGLMDQVRHEAAGLVARGIIVATRRGEVVDPLAAGGPIRLGRGPGFHVGDGAVHDEGMGSDGQQQDL